MLSAKDPVISLNGNVVALAGPEVVSLANETGAKLEVNLFYRTEERVKRLADRMRELGANDVLGESPDERIPGLDHERGKCASNGIFSADVVFVPLEDGDRTKALKKMGKKVVTIDLNPMSRTALHADITIVDNIVRAAPMMASLATLFKLRGQDEHLRNIKAYDNHKILSSAFEQMDKKLRESKRCLEKPKF